MSLLSRQQATQNWHESDPGVHFGDLLETLGMYKDIATDHGLNFSALIRAGDLETHTRRVGCQTNMIMKSSR